ncbi:MAG TPA: 3-oxoacyl-ACP synthase [Taishania sp.]|nr:3-oxoacyl-ACP synthase [Taishania sp.]HNS42217.1 3-oxoacyl-ACP synthase [Taishania sp.]
MKIIASTYLSSKGAYLNGEKIVQFTDENWLKACYQHLALDYPKFYKMDNLSKMAVLGVELLANSGIFSQIDTNDLELLFANSNASQHTDLKFIDSYTVAKNPSPSLFVYTLPNILTGELAIKHKWYGENSFYISPNFDAQLFATKIHQAYKKGVNYCLCGWIDSKLEANSTLSEESFLFLVALNEENASLHQEIEQLMTQYNQKEKE